MADEDAQQLDTTVSALQGGVTSLSPEAGVGVIDQWRERLSHETDPHLREIAGDLDTLKEALGAQQPDQVTVGEILQGLGEKTKRAAAGAGEQADALMALGDALEDQGRAVSGHG